MLNSEVSSVVHMSVQFYDSIEDDDQLVNANRFVLPEKMLTRLLQSCLHAEPEVSKD